MRSQTAALQEHSCGAYTPCALNRMCRAVPDLHGVCDVVFQLDCSDRVLLLGMCAGGSTPAFNFGGSAPAGGGFSFGASTPAGTA